MEKAILQKIENAIYRYNLSRECTAKERFQELKTAKGKYFADLCDRYGLSNIEIAIL